MRISDWSSDVCSSDLRVPGRWQMAVEGFTGFVSSMMATNIGPEGRRYTPYVFSLFMFILFCNILGMVPFALGGLHPLTVTSHLTITGVLAVLSFAIVLVVGFWRHKLPFFSLFVPHGTPWPMTPFIDTPECVRSTERRVGKECVSTFRTRWSAYN